MADRHQHVRDDGLIKMVKNVVDLRDNNIDYIVAPFKLQFGSDASLPEPYQGFGFHKKNRSGHMHLISSGTGTADYGLVVGSGSFGVVVVGKHRRSQRVVAVKISEAAKEADLKEARLMRELGHHPNIVHVEDCYYEESSRRLFVVMELMQGNLRALVESREDQKLSETELKVLTRGLASGLQHMHNHDKNGVVSIYCSISICVGLACNFSHVRGICSAHHHVIMSSSSSSSSSSYHHTCFTVHATPATDASRCQAFQRPHYMGS